MLCEFFLIPFHLALWHVESVGVLVHFHVVAKEDGVDNTGHTEVIDLEIKKKIVKFLLSEHLSALVSLATFRQYQRILRLEIWNSPKQNLFIFLKKSIFS